MGGSLSVHTLSDEAIARRIRSGVDVLDASKDYLSSIDSASELIEQALAHKEQLQASDFKTVEGQMHLNNALSFMRQENVQIMARFGDLAKKITDAFGHESQGEKLSAARLELVSKWETHFQPLKTGKGDKARFWQFLSWCDLQTWKIVTTFSKLSRKVDFMLRNFTLAELLLKQMEELFPVNPDAVDALKEKLLTMDVVQKTKLIIDWEEKPEGTMSEEDQKIGILKRKMEAAKVLKNYEDLVAKICKSTHWKTWITGEQASRIKTLVQVADTEYALSMFQFFTAEDKNNLQSFIAEDLVLNSKEREALRELNEDVNDDIRRILRVSAKPLSGGTLFTPTFTPTDGKLSFIGGDEPTPIDISNVYMSANTNSELYGGKDSDGIAKLVEKAKKGYNCIVFTYGYSGAGKTYTNLNPEGEDKGIVLRALTDLKNSETPFAVRIIEMKPEDISFTETGGVSFNHAFLEWSTDTTSVTSKVVDGKELFADEVNSTAIDAIHADNITSVLASIDAERLDKTIRPTPLNPAGSSRSHTFVEICVLVPGDESTSRTVKGRIVFGDMAGSEDITAIAAQILPFLTPEEIMPKLATSPAWWLRDDEIIKSMMPAVASHLTELSEELGTKTNGITPWLETALATKIRTQLLKRKKAPSDVSGEGATDFDEEWLKGPSSKFVSVEKGEGGIYQFIIPKDTTVIKNAQKVDICGILEISQDEWKKAGKLAAFKEIKAEFRLMQERGEKQFFRIVVTQPDRLTSSKKKQHDQWSGYKLLIQHLGEIVMKPMREGLWINESLNHLRYIITARANGWKIPQIDDTRPAEAVFFPSACCVLEEPENRSREFVDFRTWWEKRQKAEALQCANKNVFEVDSKNMKIYEKLQSMTDPWLHGEDKVGMKTLMDRFLKSDKLPKITVIVQVHNDQANEWSKIAPSMEFLKLLSHAREQLNKKENEMAVRCDGDPKPDPVTVSGAAAGAGGPLLTDPVYSLSTGEVSGAPTTGLVSPPTAGISSPTGSDSTTSDDEALDGASTPGPVSSLSTGEVGGAPMTGLVSPTTTETSPTGSDSITSDGEEAESVPTTGPVIIPTDDGGLLFGSEMQEEGLADGLEALEAP